MESANADRVKLEKVRILCSQEAALFVGWGWRQQPQRHSWAGNGVVEVADDSHGC